MQHTTLDLQVTLVDGNAVQQRIEASLETFPRRHRINTSEKSTFIQVGRLDSVGFCCFRSFPNPSVVLSLFLILSLFAHLGLDR